MLDKVGVYAGGTYVTGTDWGGGSYWGLLNENSGPFMGPTSGRWSGVVRVDVVADVRTNFMFTITGQNINTAARSDAGGAATTMSQLADRNAFSGRTVLHPITLYVGRTGPSLFYSPAGVVQDVRVCSLEKLEPEQEISIGSDVYKVFPIAAKRTEFSTAGNLPAASGFHGYAVRKVV